MDIDCPSGCPHLQAGRAYEAGKAPAAQRFDPHEMARYDEFFLNRFAAQDTYANCDGSTAPPVLNVIDFTCFLNRFAAGCS